MGELQALSVSSLSNGKVMEHGKDESFQVFLNFHGDDVKNSVGSLLHQFLRHLGVGVFVGSNSSLATELTSMNFLPIEVENAIKSAAIQVVIFSPNYASSSWCLDELAFMLKIKAKIIPVFYSVLPSDLWDMGKGIWKGIYADAFQNYKEKGKYLQRIPEWKESLHKASLISGIVFRDNSNWGDLCKNVADNVLLEIKKRRYSAKLQIAEYAVGLDQAILELQTRISQLPQNHNVKGSIVAIVGAAGVGKTTLAKEFYNRKRSKFSRSSFLLNVREAHANKTMAMLQKKLLSDLNTPLIFSDSPSVGDDENVGREVIRSQLENWYSEPLIVLDDVDHGDQLQALAVGEFLKYGALVIVTTRDTNVRKLGILNIYKVKAMDDDSARELFCWHAFRQAYPPDGFEEMVEDFLKTAGGVSSTIKVLGKHLYSLYNGSMSMKV